MKIILIYCIISFLWLFTSEIIMSVAIKKHNYNNGNPLPAYRKLKVNHFRLIVKSIFFPVTFVYYLIELISWAIFEFQIKKGKK